MESPWQRLSLPKQDELPLLLYKLNTTPKSYEIYITDLTQLWSEQLSYRQVLKRAEEDDTTIDPSEDPGQFAVLLQKIDEALRNSPGSSMALTPGRGPKPESDSLHLQLCIKLPGPLKPLKWNVHLSKRPYTESTNHLLLSLLREERDSEMRQRTLLEHLRQKDWVLAKLFDKIESMGIDLSTIFPGMSGLRGTRKETSLAQAAKYIKGVAPFNEQEWLDQSHPGGSLVKAVSAASELGVNGLQPPPDKWWESLDTRSIELTPGPEEEPAPKPKPTNEMDIDTASEDDDDGEFERQETPPRLKQQVPAEQLSPSSKKSASPAKKPESQNPSKGLGRIGRGALPKPSPSPPPKSPSPRPAAEQQVASTASTTSSPDLDRRVPPVHVAQDQETDSDSGSARPSPSPSPSPSPKQHPKDKKETLQTNKPRRGVLGVIGGKKNDNPEPAPAPSPESKPKKTGKLGVIGGKPKPKSKPAIQPEPDTAEDAESSSSPETGMEMRPKSKSKHAVKETDQSIGVKAPEPQVEPQPEPKPDPEPEQEAETEEQKADRKREELKRQLEAKSKAPVKKRRKF